MPTYNLNSGYGQVVGQWPYLGTGKVFVVGKSGLANRDIVSELMKVDPEGKARFFSTIDAAVGACIHDANDIIYVLPGHTETITATATLTLDVRGVSIVGLGHGKMRPQILIDAAATNEIAVSADDVTVKNMIFLAGHADIQTCFEVGAAKQFTVEDCDFLDNTSGENFLVAIRTNTTANAADGLTVRNCTFITPDTASLYFVHFQADCDRVTIEDCYVNMGVNTNDYAVITCATGKDLTNARILRNEFVRLNDANALIVSSDTTANSGIVAFNLMGHADTASENLVDLTGCREFENYGTAVNDKQGYLVDADS